MLSLRAAAAATFALELGVLFFCTFAQPVFSQPADLPWVRFHARLSEIAKSTSTAVESEDTPDTLAASIVKKIEVTMDRVTGRSKDFEVSYDAIVWNADILPSHQTEIVSSRLGTMPDLNDGDAVPSLAAAAAVNQQCRNQQEVIAKAGVQVGPMGWPCHRGGAVPVRLLIPYAPELNINCMVYYVPQPHPALPTRYPAVKARKKRLNDIVEHCIANQLEQLDNQYIILQEVSDCALRTYNQGSDDFPKHNLLGMRGIAVFMKYEVVPPGWSAGLRIPKAMIAEDCSEVPFKNPDIPQASICHVALLACIERFW